MKKEFNKYGRKLTKEEYYQSLDSLYRSDDPVFDNDDEEWTDEDTKKLDEDARQEFNFLIDHKLGVDFPQSKRKRLHRKIQWLNDTALVDMIGHFYKACTSGNLNFAEERKRKAFAKVLDKDDLDALLGPKK